MTIKQLLSALATACFVAQAQAGDVRVEGKFISTTTSGPPLEVSSTDNVSNLNADKLDGFDVGDFAVAGSGVGVHWKNLVGLPGREIDQDCALAVGGCFSGDSQGFPVTITEPGSYRLGSNLDVTVETSPEDVTAIRVEASNVQLDLQGFNVLGPVSCTGTPVSSCSPTGGTGDGVLVTLGRTNVLILNGTFQGMGQNGIRGSTDTQILVANVMLEQNDTFGLSSGSSIVRNVAANRNGVDGISVSGGIIDGCHALGNGRTGIRGIAESTIVNSTSHDNALDGFFAFDSRISGSSTSNNGRDGIGCNDCLMVDNLSHGNSDDGVEFLDSNAAWKGNVVYENGDVAVTGPRVSLGENACDGAVC